MRTHTTAISMSEARDMFLAHCDALNLSPKTMIWYRYRLRAALSIFEAAGISDLADISLNSLERLVSTMKANRAPKTINETITAVKTWLGWLTQEGYLSINPAVRLRKIKHSRTLIRPLSPEQVSALLAMPNKRRFTGIRDYTIMLVLLDTGIGVSEIVGIRLEDIDWQANTIKVFGKGRKERLVPMGKSVWLAIRTYLIRRGTLATDYLFVSQFGDPMQLQSVQDQLTRFGKLASTTGARVSPHTFRHTFAVNYLRNGGDIFTLKRILGHTSLDTVRLYLNLLTADISKAHESASPVDRMFDGQRPVSGRKAIS